MSRGPIPDWDIHGLLPPIGTDPVGFDRSPYSVSLVDFVDRFATSDDRRSILDGFLRFRAVLHAAGLRDGLQWVDGSFLENIESRESRPPRDLDVVTFFRLAVGDSESDVVSRAPILTDHNALRRDFHVDAYLVNAVIPFELAIGHATYWYSLWSHRRDGTWKGYVAIDLNPLEDADAVARLATTTPEES